MRHQKTGRKLNRTPSHRNAMLRNMVTSLFEYEKIETTDAKAKELRHLAEKMITLGKKGDLYSRRRALTVIRKKEVTHKLFDVLSKRLQGRNGGHLRIIKAGRRAGDGAPLSIVELITVEEGKKSKKLVSKGKTKKGELTGPKKSSKGKERLPSKGKKPERETNENGAKGP